MFRFTLLAFLPALLLGCGGPDGPQWNTTPHPVSGKIIYDGKPAQGVVVGLLPIDAPMPPAIPQNPSATTNADGSFTLTTFKEGDGACEGRYQVLLTWMATVDEDKEEARKDKLLGWYDAAHSSIYFTVKPGTNTIPTITIPPRKVSPEQMPGIPGRN